MSDGAMLATLVDIQLDSSAGLPRYRQLYDSLRASILAGCLRAGPCLPPTRALASELGIFRTIVLTAYAQLLAEATYTAYFGTPHIPK
jgi:GntR family transcriptional regulator/MocR family aminotransferase